MSTNEQRMIDALGLALGLCRNVMIDVMNDNHDPDEITRILRATSLKNIAHALGSDPLQLTWDETLTHHERMIVAGYGEQDGQEGEDNGQMDGS